MEEEYIESSVKKRLILSGIKELSEHGVRDFSLRRVALAAQVSCAAPYRHFKDKDELILGIISHVADDFELLSKQICEIYVDSLTERLIHLAVVTFRFWIANGSFRTVMLSLDLSTDSAFRLQIERFDAPVRGTVRELVGNSDDELVFTVLSLIYGAVDLVTMSGFSPKVAEERLKSGITRLVNYSQN